MANIKKQDAKKVLKGALIAAAGAGVAYLSASLDLIDWESFGKYGPIIAMIASVAINFFRKLLNPEQ